MDMSGVSADRDRKPRPAVRRQQGPVLRRPNLVRHLLAHEHRAGAVQQPGRAQGRRTGGSTGRHRSACSASTPASAPRQILVPGIPGYKPYNMYAFEGADVAKAKSVGGAAHSSPHRRSTSSTRRRPRPMNRCSGGGVQPEADRVQDQRRADPGDELLPGASGRRGTTYNFARMVVGALTTSIRSTTSTCCSTAARSRPRTTTTTRTSTTPRSTRAWTMRRRSRAPRAQPRTPSSTRT